MIREIEGIKTLIAQSEFLEIAGPCSTDSSQLAIDSVTEASKRGIRIVRNDVYKPRTNLRNVDGTRAFQGVREEGLGWFHLAWAADIIPATEIITPKHAEAVRDVMGNNPDHLAFVWTGARSGNTEVVEEMANVFAGDQRILWGTKSTRDFDTALWIGMSDAAREGGIPDEQRIMIYRGEVERQNRNGKIKRGTANWDLGIDVKRELMEREFKTNGEMKALKMVIDPAHMSTDPLEVMRLAREGLIYHENGITFDGLMIEVHPRPWESQTDKGIDWNQYDELNIPQVIANRKQLIHQ